GEEGRTCAEQTRGESENCQPLHVAASVQTDRDRILLVVEIRPSRRTPHRLCGRSGPAAPFRTDTTRIAYPVGRFGRASLAPSLFYGAHQEVRPPQEAPAGRASRPA